MNINEILRRKTRFSEVVLVALWNDLTVTEKLGILGEERYTYSCPEYLVKLAAADPSPVVRMLAVEYGASPSNDDIPLVRFAVHGRFGASIRLNAAKLEEFSHEERLSVLAMASIHGKDFVTFLRNALAAKTISEAEAGLYAHEYVMNPRSTDNFRREPHDGMDWAFDGQDLDAVWEYVCEAPEIVGWRIACHYPMETSWKLPRGVQEELFSRLPEFALCALARRKYPPLLRLIEASPTTFSRDIRDSAKEPV